MLLSNSLSVNQARYLSGCLLLITSEKMEARKSVNCLVIGIVTAGA